MSNSHSHKEKNRMVEKLRMIEKFKSIVIQLNRDRNPTSSMQAGHIQRLQMQADELRDLLGPSKKEQEKDADNEQKNILNYDNQQIRGLKVDRQDGEDYNNYPEKQKPSSGNGTPGKNHPENNTRKNSNNQENQESDHQSDDITHEPNEYEIEELELKEALNEYNNQEPEGSMLTNIEKLERAVRAVKLERGVAIKDENNNQRLTYTEKEYCKFLKKQDKTEYAGIVRENERIKKLEDQNSRLTRSTKDVSQTIEQTDRLGTKARSTCDLTKMSKKQKKKEKEYIELLNEKTLHKEEIERLEAEIERKNNMKNHYSDLAKVTEKTIDDQDYTVTIMHQEVKELKETVASHKKEVVVLEELIVETNKKINILKDSRRRKPNNSWIFFWKK